MIRRVRVSNSSEYRVRVRVVSSPSRQIRTHNLLDYKIPRQLEAEVRAVQLYFVGYRSK